MDTFLAKSIREPLEGPLTLQVRFPQDRMPDIAEGLEYDSSSPDAPLRTKTPSLLDQSAFRAIWTIERPRHWRRYSLEWRYADGGGVYVDA